ncbi:MAG: hypothetical protein ACFB9M_19460 [Myxococcota bacterium]
MKNALVQGELEEAQNQARWLAEHEAHGDLPPGWEPYFEAMQSQARKVLAAQDTTEAAIGTARVAGTCGSCHSAMEAKVRFGFEAPPPSELDPEDPAHHAWAALRMWDALVSRSDSLWRRGVAVLSRARVTPPIRNPPAEGSDLHQALVSFRSMVAAAEVADAAGSRGEVFGHYLGSCNHCHTLVEMELASH